jgi:hypothetical protein
MGWHAPHAPPPSAEASSAEPPQLDEAAKRDEALPTHLANAAASGRRRDLLLQLRRTLTVPERRAELAAARALLAMMDQHSTALLRDSASKESDAVQ